MTVSGLVRGTCHFGGSRHIEPEALARLVGWTVTLAALASRMRSSSCGKKVAEVVARPRPRAAVVGAEELRIHPGKQVRTLR